MQKNLATAPPSTFWCHGNIVLVRPLAKGILISHTLVTSATDDDQIIQNGFPALGFGHIMAALKVEDCHNISAPRGLAFALEGGANISYPELFSHRPGYLYFLCHPRRLLCAALD